MQAINTIVLHDSVYYGHIATRQVRVIHNYLHMTKNNSRIKKY